MRRKFECVAEFVYWQGRNVSWILAAALAGLLVWWLWPAPAVVTTGEDSRVVILERRVTKLEQAVPPTCVQVHPEKFQIDIYPAPNLGKHKIASPP